MSIRALVAVVVLAFGCGFVAGQETAGGTLGEIHLLPAPKMGDKSPFPGDDPGHDTRGVTGIAPPAIELGRVSTSLVDVYITITNTIFGSGGCALFAADGELIQQDTGFTIAFETQVGFSRNLGPGTYFVITWAGTGEAANGFSTPGGNSDMIRIDRIGGPEYADGGYSISGTRRVYQLIVTQPTLSGPGYVVPSRSVLTSITTEFSGFDTELGLFSGSGSRLDDNDDAYIDGMIVRWSELDNLALTPGDYFLSISGNYTGFGHRFLVGTNPSSDGGTWRLNLFGQTVADGWIEIGTSEFKKLTIRDEGDSIPLTEDICSLQTVTIYTSSTTDPMLALFGPAGELIASDDDSNGPNPLISTHLTAGMYTVAVNGFRATYGNGFGIVARDNASSGDYTLHFGSFSSYPTTLDAGGDTDFYSFVVEDPGHVGEAGESIQAIEFSTLGSTPNTALAVWDAAGNLLAYDFDSSDSDAARVSFAPGSLPPGDYVAAVTGEDAGFGPGFSTVQSPSLPFGPARLVYQPGGAFEPVDLDYGGDADLFWFSVGAPTELGTIGFEKIPIELSTQGSAFNTALAIWDESGELLAMNDDAPGGTDSLINRVYEPGAYYAAVAGSGAGFEPGFRVLVNGSEPTGGHQLLAGGTMLASGATSPTDLYDFYRFEIGVTPPCNDADLAEPFGLLDLADVLAFVSAFLSQDPSVDFNENGLWDLSDVLVFVNSFNAGCP
ncbi:MAG: hypothetical protein H6810_12225 [Phycisphaeraceae bacterium]|nr:MAG: hypothetical protein H6810_12225 [Phycisphaeraceae bacterium]